MVRVTRFGKEFIRVSDRVLWGGVGWWISRGGFGESGSFVCGLLCDVENPLVSKGKA